MLVGVIFKALLYTSQRYMPVIFGNVWAKTVKSEREKQREITCLSLIHFACCISLINSWGQILLPVHLRITVCQYDAHLSK